MENGSFGDCKQLSGNLFELRFFFAGGLRIYYTIRAEKIVLLLAGGGKATQHKDIATAEKLMRETECNSMNKTSLFDIAEHLETDDDIRGFLHEVAATGSEADFIHALGIAARAKGMTEVAKRAGVTRASLYKSLSSTGSPKFDTVVKVLEALGCRLAVV